MNVEVESTAVATTQRRTLYDSALLQIGHVAVQPHSTQCGPVEEARRPVLALPLAGVFAKHDSPRQQVVATRGLALLIRPGQPYRLSFPGAVGDRCLVLRWSDEALALAQPLTAAAAHQGFGPPGLAAQVLLPPALLLALARLQHRLQQGPLDPLHAEEAGLALLGGVLAAAGSAEARARPAQAVRPSRRGRAVQAALAAMACEPQRRWTLSDLARTAHVSPGHLAHLFPAELGITAYGCVLRLRLAGALPAVLDGHAGLTEVALQAGFASHSHFTAHFRALFGTTPQALRQRAPSGAGRELRRIATAPLPLAA